MASYATIRMGANRSLQIPVTCWPCFHRFKAVWYRVVYEDTAPFFTYSGSWRAGSSADDKAAEQYSDSSFMVTQAQGASFSFMFYGTEVSIFGSKRIGHGAYQVTLDGVASSIQNGDSSTSQFNATLFTANAGKGLHTVSLVNKEDRFLDVDMVEWTASVGKDDEPLIVNTWQDFHPNFKYSPADAWTTVPPDVGTFSAGSGHGTSTVGAYAQVTFTGDAIALYGPAGPNGPALYSVQVDSQSSSRYSGVKQFQRSRQLLYYGGNFGEGTHTLTLKLESVSDRQVLAVDYIEVYTTPSLGGSFDSASSSKPVGLIVGISILSVIVALTLGLLTYIYYLYKNGRLNIISAKGNEDESEYPDMQSYQGNSGYQPTITSPLSTYPGYMNHSYSGMQATYPDSSISPTVPSAGTEPSFGYGRPALQRTVTDPGSTVAATRASSTIRSPSSGVSPSRSIRKYRLEPQDEVEEPSAASAPPPAYLDS